MTEMDRINTIRLYHRGYGYKKIAKELGLSPNTVKSFLIRHPTSREAVRETERFCKNCGEPLKQMPHKRKKIFCSDSCRMKWWNSHTEQVERKAYYDFVCRECGKKFESYGNSHRKFCSRACYVAFRRKAVSR